MPYHRSEEHTSELQSLRHLVCRLIRSEEHTSELQSLRHLVCRLLLEKKKKTPVQAKTIRVPVVYTLYSRLPLDAARSRFPAVSPASPLGPLSSFFFLRMPPPPPSIPFPLPSSFPL